MGGQPKWALLALELNEHDDVEDVLQAAAEMAHQLALHGATVVGGDLGIGQGPQRWTLTLMATPGPRTLTMSQAKAGYRVWLIGEVGRAAVGLNALIAGDSSTEMAPLIESHLRPRALVDAGMRLADLPYDIAATDVSDGLWIDAVRLAEKSDVGLELHLPRPDWLSPSIVEQVRRYGLDWRELMVTGGDDYALLVCAPWSLDLRQELSSVVPLSIEAIGQVVQGDLVSIHVEGERLTGVARGYEHGR